MQTVQWGVSLLERKSNTTHEGLIVVASSMEVAPDTRNGPRDSSCFLLEDVTGSELCGEEPRSWKSVNCAFSCGVEFLIGVHLPVVHAVNRERLKATSLLFVYGRKGSAKSVPWGRRVVDRHGTIHLSSFLEVHINCELFDCLSCSTLGGSGW